jgi:uncharacterized Zn finger protein
MDRVLKVIPVKTSSLLDDILDRRTLKHLAGAQSFARGEDYFVDGQVKP